MPNILAKMFFGISFGLVYIFVYGGGDTIAYYDGAVCMNNLFFKSPEHYFDQIFSAPDIFKRQLYYDSITGYPPGWIYREPEAFFISKIISIFSFFTLKSYFAMTIIISTFTAHASWLLFKLVRAYDFSKEKLLVFGILFLPSVNFWCSGVSKDSVVFISSVYLVYHLFKILSPNQKTTTINVVILIINMFIIYHIRIHILFAILIPAFFAISARLIRIIGGGNIAVVAGRTAIILAGILVIGNTLIIETEDDLVESNDSLKEAALIQNDFKKNTIYGSKKYDLGDVEFTPTGILKIMPLVIITGIYRPFIWEALSPTLILNGIESLIFLYLTFVFFRRKFLQKWNYIRSHEFLIFCFIFVLIIAFMTGMTSILYGVLVRLRAPLLPFFVILLTIDIANQNSEDHPKELEV